jgi:eukaryotic-like serine/threonine-protein kinase
VRIRLMDFGIGKLTASAPDVTGITRQGDIIGTPCYMPPEQLTGRGIDARADLYACGVVLFEMLSGKLPFNATSVAEVVASVLRDEIPNVRTVREDVPAAVAEVIAKATAKDPKQRYANAERMKLALVGAQRAARQEHKPSAMESAGQYV